MSRKRGPSRYSAHQGAAKYSELQRTLGQELSEHYRLPRNVPHQLLTLLIRLNDRVEQRRNRRRTSARSSVPRAASRNEA